MGEGLGARPHRESGGVGAAGLGGGVPAASLRGPPACPPARAEEARGCCHPLPTAAEPSFSASCPRPWGRTPPRPAQPVTHRLWYLKGRFSFYDYVVDG